MRPENGALIQFINGVLYLALFSRPLFQFLVYGLFVHLRFFCALFPAPGDAKVYLYFLDADATVTREGQLP